MEVGDKFRLTDACDGVVEEIPPGDTGLVYVRSPSGLVVVERIPTVANA